MEMSSAAWINRELYPYDAKAFPQPVGTMRYVDEGSTEHAPIVMVHGNPTWSFVYRKLINGLRDSYRCIAPDHIGFGQSHKPYHWSYTPQDHAANLARLLDALDLKNITLVVQDWGGPIGLSYAVRHPKRVSRLVILNTWMWPVNESLYYRAFSGVMGGPLGRFLCRNYNTFVNTIVPMATGDKSKLTPEIMHHYRAPLPTGDSRKGTWVFPRQIIASTDWLAGLWGERAKIAAKPTMLAWGMKDIAFREDVLARWQQSIPHAEVHRFESAGHFVQDEMGDDIAALIRSFIQTPVARA